MVIPVIRNSNQITGLQNQDHGYNLEALIDTTPRNVVKQSVMKNILAVLPFVAMTFVSWGVYGPLLHEGKHAMNESSLRPFVGVGIAYFIIAVIVPIIMLRRGEKGHWSVGGTLLSFLAGSVGALGALGVILALTAGGKPIFVMPVVFGFAPVVNTLVTSYLSKTFDQINPKFLAGMLAVALGAVGVLVYKPLPAPAKPHSESAGPATVTPTSFAVQEEKNSESEKPEASGSGTAADQNAVEQNAGASQDAEQKEADQDSAAGNNTAETTSSAKPVASEVSPLNSRVFGALIMAALCWGSYGPFLHIGQMKMGGSRLRPFCCVGLAYFLIAVAVPLLILSVWNEPGEWTVSGTAWSIAAGSAGALGALGIILAFNFGGKPIYVMPLIFGFAPVVNTLTTMATSGTISDVSIPFVCSLAIVIAGAVTVLIFAPKPKPHAAPAK